MIDQCFYRLRLPFRAQWALPEFPERQNHLELPADRFPELSSWLSTLGLEIQFAEIFRKTPSTNVSQTIHVDGLALDDHAKINFVQGGGSSVMRWWRPRTGTTYRKLTTVIGTPYYSLEYQDAEMIAQDPIAGPTIVNAGGMFHNVEDITEPRYCWSFRLQYKNSTRRVLWPEVKALFNKYIVANRSHRALKLPVALNPPAIKFVDSRAVDIPLDQLNPALVDWLYDTHRLKVRRYQCFWVPPLHGVAEPRGLHADTNVPASCKLNWSYGAPNSVMRWFWMKPGIDRPQERTESHELYGGISTKFVEPSYEDVYELYRARISRPSLVNVYQPHDVINYDDSNRYTYTIVLQDPERPAKNLLWDQALELFKPYVISL